MDLLQMILPQNSTVPKQTELVLVVDHLYKSFGNNHVLIDFNLQLYNGESVVVLGKSGSGKSVLIKCIIGLLKPDKGSINVFGKNVLELNDSELDSIRAKIGFLFQSNALYDSMTVRENLEFPLRRHRKNLEQSQCDKLITQSLKDVGLLHTIDMMPAELSGGMRKRIALARTLILQPRIILYDEPTTGLDPITAREIIDLMIEINEKYNTSSLVITHDKNCVRLASDRVLVLLDGKCYASGTYMELSQSRDERIKAFFE